MLVYIKEYHSVQKAPHIGCTEMAYLQCVSSGDLPKYVQVQKTSYSTSIYMAYPHCVFWGALPE